jgi:hypothetical protein
MNPAYLIDNLLNPPLLFFLLGAGAALVRSDLEIPQPFPKILSLYLLFAIGFKGGVELSHSGLGGQTLAVLVSAVAMSLLVPCYVFFLMRGRLGAENAAAVAATYGSISAVTFMTAIAFLESKGVSYGGHMVAAMALMESPAIVAGVLLLRMTARGGGTTTLPAGGSSNGIAWNELLRDSFFNGSVFLLTGSLLIGAATGDRGWEAVRPLTDDLFTGVLCLFLLDLGIVATRRLEAIRKAGLPAVAFALGAPPVHAVGAMLLARLLGLDRGDALLLTILAASASYIAVPAAMRLAVPRANPSIYVTMALALTFPFNIVVGIPLYYSIIQAWWS